MKPQLRINWDKVGATASTICAVHCLLTGVAIGLLSVAGLGFVASFEADVAFLSVALIVGVIAVIHGIRKHHSWRPAMIFLFGLASIAMGHFAFRHGHGATPESPKLASTLFSVLGGVSLVVFHLVNLRLQHRCGCGHCARGE